MRTTVAPSHPVEFFTLTDTGPLVALADKEDNNFVRAQNQLKQLSRSPLLTLWPCMTEASHLLGREGGYPAQAVLLRFLQAGAVQIWNPEPAQAAPLQERVIEVMATYRDLPCDFTDAALVAAAEILNVSRIFTFDSHFYAYRIANGSAFEVVP